MNKIVVSLVFLIAGSLAQASPLDCKTLSSKVITNLGKQNSGSQMRLDSIKQTSVKNTSGSAKTYKYEIYMKDPNTDSYDGYDVTAQSFANGGCIIEKIQMFQYD